MASEEQINRLGFGTWADNLIADFIENHRDTMVMGTGHISAEKTDGTMLRAEYGEGKANIVVRGYSSKTGWQTHERSLKL